MVKNGPINFRSFSPDLHIDNNIRYVSLQDLGKLAVIDLGAFLQNVDVVVSNFEAALRDKDQVLRACRNGCGCSVFIVGS